ncbi:MAG: hypothetical protein HY293_14785 [Planctomycetes bacterium]|nr:hypothetical protein [Planctomycetota bacterium]
MWINVRTTPVPDLACMEDVLHKVEVDPDGMVQGNFNQGFFLRSVVLASDGETLLNPQPGGASLFDLVTDGHFPYGQVKPKHYLPMLRGALERARAGSDD